MTSSVSSKEQRGSVTAIELVLILFVGLLIVAIAMPARIGGRTSPAATCLSNMKNLGVGMVMYSSDHDERLPNADAWSNEIASYVKNPKAFNCPLLPTGSFGGYAMSDRNSGQVWKGNKKPSNQVLLFETVGGVMNAHGAPVPMHPSRHKERDLFVYTDLHARAVPSSKDE